MVLSDQSGLDGISIKPNTKYTKDWSRAQNLVLLLKWICTKITVQVVPSFSSLSVSSFTPASKVSPGDSEYFEYM